MKTEIAFILDRSGSMDSIRQSAIDSFNSFLRDQQAAPDPAHFTLVFFDTFPETRHLSLPIAEIPPLKHETYRPNGSTALLDAIGDTIDRLGERLASLPESERPDHVTVAILTDGEENSSRHFDWLQVADRIKHQTDTYQWEFLFLGAGPDTIATASRLHINLQNASAFTADSIGQSAAMASISRKTLASRAIKGEYATPQHLNDAKQSIASILHDELDKHQDL